jgi:hypothetical protein
MSNTINVTVELCKEDRQRIDELIAFAGLIVGELKSRPVIFTAPQETPDRPVPEIMHPADILPPHGEPEPAADPEPVEAPEPELPKYTTADILAKVQSMAGPGNPKREKAKAIVMSYGKKVSDIPEDKRTEAMLRLIELEQAPLEG